MQKNPSQTPIHSRNDEDEENTQIWLAKSIFDHKLRTGIFLNMQFLQILKNHKKELQELSFYIISWQN